MRDAWRNNNEDVWEGWEECWLINYWKYANKFLEGVFSIIIVYITWQGIGLNEDKLNWWCMDVYEIVNENGQFRLLVFQREFEHGNEGIWHKSLRKKI